MIEVKTEFSDLERRFFGPLFATFMGIVMGIMVRHSMTRTALCLMFCTSGLIVVYYLVPTWQNRIYRGWLLALSPIGIVVSYFVLALIYWGIMTPIGVVLRLIGHDPLTLGKNAAADTYWVERGGPRPSRDYFRQY